MANATVASPPWMVVSVTMAMMIAIKVTMTSLIAMVVTMAPDDGYDDCG